MTHWPVAQGELLRVILDAMPSAVFVADADVNILDLNRAASSMIAQEPINLKQLCGALLGCFNALQASDGCGTAKECANCVIRNGVRLALEGQGSHRKHHRMHLTRAGKTEEVHFLVTITPFTFEQTQYFLIILEDITDVMELRGLIPICASCKKIRNDQQFWEHVDSYLRKHTNLQFSHGICPACAELLYPETD